MKVVTWNLRKPAGKRIAAIADAIAVFEPDVVLLQEVSARNAASLRDELGERAGLSGWGFIQPPPRSTKAYGSAIAARGKVDVQRWSSRARLNHPQLLAHAVVTVGKLTFDAVSIHAPNAAGNGWQKIDAIDSMLTKVGSISGPCVVAGDFNEPYRFQHGGHPISFRTRPQERQRPTYRDKFGVERDRDEWQRAVAAALGSLEEQSLRHAWFAHHDRAAVSTHVVGGQKRFFDHILVTHHFDVRDAGFEHRWRTPRNLSDHSAAWAVLSLARVA
jgi:endonuclease/exonuclease/phosphatase family metal-dependent hydrolase